MQDPNRDGADDRGRIIAQKDGYFCYRAVLPTAYPIVRSVSSSLSTARLTLTIVVPSVMVWCDGVVSCCGAVGGSCMLGQNSLATAQLAIYCARWEDTRTEPRTYISQSPRRATIRASPTFLSSSPTPSPSSLSSHPPSLLPSPTPDR